MSGGFLPKNYIRSGAFSKSKRTVSPRDTGLIPKDRKNPLHDNPIIPTQEKKCRIFGTFLMLSIFS